MNSRPGVHSATASIAELDLGEFMMKTPLIIASMMALAIFNLSSCSEPNRSMNPQAPTPPPPPTMSLPILLQPDELKLSLTPVSRCNLERANDTVFANTPVEIPGSEPELALSGWVVNNNSNTTPAGMDIRMIHVKDGQSWKVPVKVSVERDDIVKLLSDNADFINAGYAVNVDTRNMPAGTYRLIIVFQENGVLKVCDNGRSVIIR